LHHINDVLMMQVSDFYRQTLHLQCSMGNTQVLQLMNAAQCTTKAVLMHMETVKNVLQSDERQCLITVQGINISTPFTCIISKYS